MRNEEALALLDKLEKDHSLSRDEYELLILAGMEEETQLRDSLRKEAAARADRVRRQFYGTDVYIRGLIEVGNVCRNDCFYCGIRRSNSKAERYVLSEEQILSCCREGYELGFRTFVLQGGEGVMKTDAVVRIISAVKQSYPDCAVTLSLGECGKEDYRRFREAGADRYLLRHETADPDHYRLLHPDGMSWEHRMQCLANLKELGFQTGCGFMVGSPYQKAEHLAKDLKFIEEFHPEMCGIGPFLPQKDTPFGTFPAGSAIQTVFLLSLIRLIHPAILLPATTALASIRPDGRRMGIRAGANVIMPNLSPASQRRKYALYDHKKSDGEEAAQSLALLKNSMEQIGYRIVTGRGDPQKHPKE